MDSDPDLITLTLTYLKTYSPCRDNRWVPLLLPSLTLSPLPHDTEALNLQKILFEFLTVPCRSFQKSSARTLSPEDCIFPDLVDCSTPVELILPSLATSTWSRGLGHLVHAQNIRTVGNLSALSEDQVQNLPIRSPKVSTLRRVLRNFHEIRASKSPKVLQQRGNLVFYTGYFRFYLKVDPRSFTKLSMLLTQIII